jgi:hypothetical protein
MTEASLDLLQRRVKALGRVSFPPGIASKRFVREMQSVPAEQVSPAQAAWIERLAWRYRRQLPKELVPAVQPAGKCRG